MNAGRCPDHRCPGVMVPLERGASMCDRCHWLTDQLTAEEALLRLGKAVEDIAKAAMAEMEPAARRFNRLLRGLLR